MEGKTYIIRIKDAPCFDGAEIAQINNSVWDRAYRPRTYGEAIFVPGDGFYVRLSCHESMPLARYTNFYDPVYTDSCMEFFANFKPSESDIYINCEMNSLGASLIGVGPKRGGRTKLSEYSDVLPEVTATVECDKWSVVLSFPLSILEKVYGKLDIADGYEMRGNMYKCGDDTPVLHHLMWNPVEIPAPDFHRPDFFGTFIVKA